MLGEIIAAIVIGIIAGYLGRALLPGDDSMGFVATVAVGIAAFPADGGNPADLLAHADRAMYVEKAARNGSVR